MYILKEASKLKERVTPKYVEGIKNDMLIFLKNIKRIKSPEQYRDLNKEWVKWINTYLKLKLGKVMFGKDTLDDHTSILERKYTEFIEWSIYCLMPSELESKRARVAYEYGLYSAFGKDLLDFDLGKSTGSLFNDNSVRTIWDHAFAIFKNNEASKYISVKKKIDDYFNGLMDYLGEQGSEELFIEDDLMVEGIPVHIEYKEANYTNGTTQYDYIHKAVDDLKKAIKLIKDSKFSKALTRTKFTLSTVDKAAERTNIHSGEDYGTGGFFNIKTNETTLLQGRLLTYRSFAVIEAVIHESGHKYYYDILSSEQRKSWEKYYNQLKNYGYEEFDMEQLYGSVELFQKALYKEGFAIVEPIYRDLEVGIKVDPKKYELFSDTVVFASFVESILPKIFKDFIKKTYNQSVEDFTDILWSKVKVDTKVDKEHWIITPEAIKEFSFEAFDYMGGLITRRPKQTSQFVTKYGSVNESEFFAETFTAYCMRRIPEARNQFNLLEPIFAKFIEITGIRSAWHESQKIKEGTNKRLVTHANFDEAYNHVKEGLTYFQIVGYRPMNIESKSIKSWEKAGLPILKLDKDGKGFRLGKGKEYVYILPGQLVELSY